jgi:hypothetical protein
MSFQHYIQEGTKAFCKTRHSNIELLCTVVMVDNYNVKVKLPCPIKGVTHDVVNLKDIRCLPPEKEIIPQPVPYHKNPESNPFRKLVDSLIPIDDDLEIIEAAKPQPIEAPQKRIDIQAASSDIKKNPLGLSNEELDFLEGLSKADQKAYMDLLK